MRLPQSFLLLLSCCSAPAAGIAPSLSCDQVSAQSIEAQICDDPGLAQLDLELDRVYQQARAKAANEHPPILKAEQRGWIKGRDDCWKSQDQRRCIESAYQLRIAELQARYRLVESKGPIFFACDDDPRNEVIVSFFDTNPQTLIAERGDSVSLMFRQPSASGTRYQGQNESFWEHQGEARIVWGFEAPEMVCVKQQHQAQ